jgi:hypothetical protein
MSNAALIASWACWVTLAASCGLAVTLTRHSFWGRPGIRWASVGGLLFMSAQLVNLYVYRLHLHARWAPLLFTLTAPCLVIVAIINIRSLRNGDTEGQPPA